MADLEEIVQRLSDGLERQSELTEEWIESVTSQAKKAAAGKSRTTDPRLDTSSFDKLNNSVRGSSNELNEMQDSANSVNKAWNDMGKSAMQITSAFGSSIRSIMANGDAGFEMLKGFVDPIGDILGTVVHGAGSIVAGLLKVASGIPFIGGILAAFGDAVAKTSAALGAAVAAIFKFAANLLLDGWDQLWTMFKGAASAGVLLADGFNQMNKQRELMGLTDKEYLEVIKGTRDQLVAFGGSVGLGARRLAEVGKYSVQFRDELLKMGVSFKEQVENQADYMAVMQRAGKLRALSDEQVAGQSAAYSKNLAVMSSLTGKSVDELKKERNQALSNMAMRAKMAAMPPEISVEMNKVLTGMPKGLERAVQESVIFGRVISDTGAIVSGMAPIVERYTANISSGSMTQSEAFQSMLNEIKAAGPELRAKMNSMAAAGQAEFVGKGNASTASINSFYDGVIDFIGAAENSTTDLVQTTADAGKLQGKAVDDMIVAVEAQRALQNAMLKLAQDSFPLAASVFKFLNVNMKEAAEKFTNIILGLADDLASKVEQKQAKQKFDDTHQAVVDGIVTTGTPGHITVANSLRDMPFDDRQNTMEEMRNRQASQEDGSEITNKAYYNLRANKAKQEQVKAELIAARDKRQATAAAAKKKEEEEEANNTAKVIEKVPTDTVGTTLSATDEAVKNAKAVQDRETQINLYKLNIARLENKNATLEQDKQTLVPLAEANPNYDGPSRLTQIDDNQEVINVLKQLIREIRKQTAAII